MRGFPFFPLTKGRALMYDLIASPFLGDYLLIRPGRHNGIKIPGRRTRRAGPRANLPGLAVRGRRSRVGIDLTGRLVAGAVLIHGESALATAAHPGRPLPAHCRSAVISACL